MCWKVEEKGFFCSLASVGVGFRGIVCDLTPNSDGLVRKVWQDDNLAPFSSDKSCEGFISGNQGVRTPSSSHFQVTLLP